MATSKGFLDFILDQLSGLDGISHKRAFGEYILYYNGKAAAYLCDDRLLVKPTASARAMLPDAPQEPPYPGAEEMLRVERVDDREFLAALFAAMEAQLPAPKKKSGGDPT